MIESPEFPRVDMPEELLRGPDFPTGFHRYMLRFAEPSRSAGRRLRMQSRKR